MKGLAKRQKTSVQAVLALAALGLGAWIAGPTPADAGLIGSSMVSDEGAYSDASYSDSAYASPVPFQGQFSTSAKSSSLVVTLEYVNASSGQVMYQSASPVTSSDSRSGTVTFTFNVPGSTVNSLSGGEWSLRADARRTSSSVFMSSFSATMGSGAFYGAVPGTNLARQIGEGLLTF